MKQLLYIDIENFKDGSIAFELFRGNKPSIGSFGPRLPISKGTAPNLDAALRVLVLEMQTNPEVQQWVKTHGEAS